MEEENHLNPLNTAINSHKSDEELVTSKPFTPPIISSHQKRSSKFLVYLLLAVVLLSIALLVFSLVLLRVENPTLQLSTVAVKNLQYQTSSLNLTLVAEIRLNNMNFGRFRFRGGNTILLYENATIGATNISDGIVESREKRRMNVTMKVIKANNELPMNFTRDVDLGSVKLISFAELRGEVRVVKIINRRRTCVMNCTMDLNLRSQVIQKLSCQ